MRTDSQPLGFADMTKRKTIQTRDGLLLQRIDTLIDWNFADEMHTILYTVEVGRKPYDTKIMIKSILLQQLYGLSDAQAEKKIYDPRAFDKFLNLSADDSIPDETCTCRFRTSLINHKMEHTIFDEVQNQLKKQKHGLSIHRGKITDATMDEMHRGRKQEDGSNTRDTNAGFTRKDNQTYHGYKGHVETDIHEDFIQTVYVSTATDHDSKQEDKITTGFEPALFQGSTDIHAEKKRAMRKAERFYGVAERATRGHPLSIKQKKQNRKCSSARVRGEHPFAEVKYRMHFQGRCRTIRKNQWHFRMVCAVYNIKRLVEKFFKAQKQAVVQIPTYSL